MLRKSWLLLPLLLVTIVAVQQFPQQRAIRFGRLDEAKADLESSGYQCTTDRADGRLDFGFLVTHEPLTWRDVGAIKKIGSSAEEWRGRVWVTRYSERFRLETVPDYGELRIWGKLVAFGDPTVLRDIEQSLKRPV